MLETEQTNEVFVRQLGLDDWEKYKNIRLEALQNDPQAFGGSYEKELQRTNEEWQGQMEKITGENAKGILVAAQNQEGELVGTIGAS